MNVSAEYYAMKPKFFPISPKHSNNVKYIAFLQGEGGHRKSEDISMNKSRLDFNFQGSI